MPTIKDFGAFKLTIYFEDENPPHVHLVGPDFSAKIRISDHTVFAGDAPAKAQKQAVDYVRDHRDDLMALWDEYSA